MGAGASAGALAGAAVTAAAVSAVFAVATQPESPTDAGVEASAVAVGGTAAASAGGVLDEPNGQIEPQKPLDCAGAVAGAEAPG